ncbi:uncharacterized protein (DUF983 family) [Sphingobium sp. OAS761]|uniref:DUF983 domain-containing protein n=1 Tax=Sphingobium sp. OAS761 TaxID=2817901 RepID=UPI00209EDA6F|nr:DUF983 domain-containing protein [Sphingobium sp. OAS761]MCP1471140.1 uncharacterized protein (DUF983 family) [Sphingobium sp. OAS761]
MTDPLSDTVPDRPAMDAIKHGLRGRCPACGQGRLFARFLKPVSSCRQCGTRIDLHQADDFPAYIVILLLGHILVPLMIEVNAALAIPLGWQAVLWPLLAVILATAMIQPVKGAVIAFQWSRRLAGFR